MWGGWHEHRPLERDTMRLVSIGSMDLGDGRVADPFACPDSAHTVDDGVGYIVLVDVDSHVHGWVRVTVEHPPRGSAKFSRLSLCETRGRARGEWFLPDTVRTRRISLEDFVQAVFWGYEARAIDTPLHDHAGTLKYESDRVPGVIVCIHNVSPVPICGLAVPGQVVGRHESVDVVGDTVVVV